MYEVQHFLDVSNGQMKRKLDLNAGKPVIAVGPPQRRGAGSAHQELEALGFRTPESVPTSYRVARSVLTTDETIE